MEYDWDNRVNTTSGTTSWRARLLGMFHSPYQPTEPILFREMMASLPIEFDQFTFIDIGSGKGRTLLMASEYPFRKIVGVELIAELHQAAEENIRSYRSPTQRCAEIESVLGNARDFELPEDPLVLYLFNPLTERTLSDSLQRLQNSLGKAPRPVWIVYHNPVLEPALATCGFLQKRSERRNIRCIGRFGNTLEVRGHAACSNGPLQFETSGKLPRQHHSAAVLTTCRTVFEVPVRKLESPP